MRSPYSNDKLASRKLVVHRAGWTFTAELPYYDRRSVHWEARCGTTVFLGSVLGHGVFGTLNQVLRYLPMGGRKMTVVTHKW